jgi:proline iminopeptidase
VGISQSASEQVLFPPLQTYDQGLQVMQDGHHLHWEEVGSPSGTPVFFLHGGPGGMALPVFRRLFDPAHWRLILFDQRGCGRSKPTGLLRNNDTSHLLDDIEQLRVARGVSRMVLCGGSWGATLALEYAKRHPARVLGMLLYGVFVGGQTDIDAFFTASRAPVGSPAHLAWRAFMGHLEPDERRIPLQAYHNRIHGRDERTALAASLMWARYEALIGAHPHGIGFDFLRLNKSQAQTLASLSSHYFMNNMFIGMDGVLGDLSRLRKISTIIVHGSEDLVCDVDRARRLHAELPAARLHVLSGQGHSPQTAEYWQTLVSAGQSLQKQCAK